MYKKINWSIPVMVLVMVGIYYILGGNFKLYKEPLEIDSDSVTLRRGQLMPDSACVDISFCFPVVARNSSAKLTKTVLSDYLQMLDDSSGVGSMNDFKARLVDQALRYDSAYVEYINEFADASFLLWYLKINYVILRNDGRLLTICYLYSDYMGGAHGISNYHYQNVDTRRGKILSVDDIVVDMAAFYGKAESAFKAELARRQNGGDGEFRFSDNQFTLPQEFGLGSKGLLLHYNVYEIASYAQGDILVEIPYSELQSVLKRKWKYLAED